MPIEVKELVIRATVDEQGEKKGRTSDPSESREEIVSSCVEQVLEILRKEKER